MRHRELGVDRALGNLLWDPKTGRKIQNDSDLENVRSLRCDAVHVCVFRYDSVRRSGRRLLHYGWRSSSSWLRLSDHGDMPGRIRRYRRHVLAQCLVQCLVQKFQRLPGLSIKATTFTVPQRTHRELIGRSENPIRMVRPPGLISEAARV
jgi:hypothetical protein